jgi:cardiolipin synthase
VRKQSKAASERAAVKLLIQPGDGLKEILKGISSAKESIDIVIFRFDQSEVEEALAEAVRRGVAVCALIASINRAGEESLRKLELRLLGAGVRVARSANDLIRYHGKFMIIDQRQLYLLAFNWTHADMERSRSFGIITTKREAVRDAARLFDADSRRIPLEPPVDDLVVSPINARKQLADFIRKTKKDLVIYDPKVSDPSMAKLLDERAKAGVTVRMIGRLQRRIPGVTARKLAGLRLHTRSMVRDGKHAFVGSQSLREAELDARREVGLFFRNPKAVAGLMRTFEDDWNASESNSQAEVPTAKIARKLAKAVVQDLPPLAPILNGAVKEGTEDRHVDQIAQEVADLVRGAVHEEVKDAVEEAVEKAAEGAG